MKRHLTLAAVLFLAFGFLTGCEDDGETLILDGIDCGLIRAELVGNWTVTLPTDAATLVDCTGFDPTIEGDPMDTTSASIVYIDTDVFGNDASPSFRVEADPDGVDDDTSVNPEFVMNIGADSCQAFFRVWEPDDGLFVQCIGNFERANGTISTFCDSAEVDTDGLDGTDTTCSLDTSIAVGLVVN